jgi:hypothetical protein
MSKLLYKLKPQSGVSYAIHIALNVLLPIIVFSLIRLDLVIIAAVIVLLSKWRMLAVKPRYWVSNIRANLVDIFVGLSSVAFMAGTSKWYTQAVWAGLYIVWLVWLKQQSKPLAVTSQALIAQILALVAFYRAFPNGSILINMIAVWLICYAVARHFLSAFDESLVSIIANIWAWFGLVMAWTLGHWAIDYLFLPQIALILSILGYGLVALYYLHSKSKLTSSLKHQLLGVLAILLLIVIVFSDWQDKTV